MILQDVVNSVLSSLGQEFVEPGREPPVNAEYLSLCNAAERFLRDTYQEIVGVQWPSLPGGSLRSRVGWPEKVRSCRHHIAEANDCAAAFCRLLADELADRGMTWPEWEWPDGGR